LAHPGRHLVVPQARSCCLPSYVLPGQYLMVPTPCPWSQDRSSSAPMAGAAFLGVSTSPSSALLAGGGGLPPGSLEHSAPEGLTSRRCERLLTARFLRPRQAGRAIGKGLFCARLGPALSPLLTDTPCPPACSWAVVERGRPRGPGDHASHNPPEWAGPEDHRVHFGGFGGRRFHRPGRAPLWRPVASNVPLPGRQPPRFDADETTSRPRPPGRHQPPAGRASRKLGLCR